MKLNTVILLVGMTSQGIVAQTPSTSSLVKAVASQPLCHIHKDTLRWRDVDSLGRGWCLYERFSRDSMVPVLSNARVLYTLFSPTVVFPSPYVEEVNNSFAVVLRGDTLIATAPAYDLESCIYQEGFVDWYQGVPLYKDRSFGSKRALSLSEEQQMTWGDSLRISFLTREGVSHLVQVTLTGVLHPTDSRFDPEWSEINNGYLYGMVRIPFQLASGSSCIAGAPVLTLRGNLGGIVQEVVWVSEGDEPLGLFAYCKIFRKL